MLIGYADDVVAFIPARDVQLAQLKLKIEMLAVRIWMADHGHLLALNKTEIVFLTMKRIPTVFPMRVEKEVVKTKPAAKYLGVMAECMLCYWAQGCSHCFALRQGESSHCYVYTYSKSQRAKV